MRTLRRSGLSLAVLVLGLALFHAPAVAQPRQPDAAPTTPDTQIPEDENDEARFWAGVKDNPDPGVIRSYLEKYPDGRFAGLARLRLAELESKARKPDDGPAGTDNADGSAGPGPTGPTLLKVFGRWSIYYYSSDALTLCFIQADSSDSEGDAGGGRRFYFNISNFVKTADNRLIQFQPSIINRRNFRTKSTVRVRVGRRAFDFFTQTNSAWIDDVRDEAAMIAEMRDADAIEITARLHPDSEVHDRISLVGFDGALSGMARYCPTQQE